MIYENDITWKRDLPETVLPEQEYRLVFFFFFKQRMPLKALSITVFNPLLNRINQLFKK